MPDAYAVATVMDRYWIESYHGGTVVEEAIMVEHCAAWELDGDRMYGGVSTTSSVIVNPASAPVYMFILMGDALDGELAVAWIQAVTTYGFDAPPPVGFVEIALEQEVSL